MKYENAEIWAKTVTERSFEHVPVHNLPWQLLKLAAQSHYPTL